MTRPLSRSIVTAAAVALLALAIACSGGEDATAPDLTSGDPLPPTAESVVYIALGDSIAAGQGASGLATGYVPLVARALRDRYGDAVLVHPLAVGAHTSQDLIEQQLPEAIKGVRAGLNDPILRVVTITIGGNDMFLIAAEPACIDDPADPECPLEDGLLETERHLDQILRELTEANPQAVIVIQLYANLFSGTGHPFARSADTAYGLLNGVITGVARRYGVPLADARAVFEGRGSELTHLRDLEPDAHPNDAGYRAIADAFLEALGLLPKTAGE